MPNASAPPAKVTDEPAVKDKEQRFCRLYERYHKEIVRFFRRRGISPERAEELAQETFLRVYRGMDDYREEASERTWILTIATHLFANELRHDHAKERDKEVSLAVAVGEPGGPPEPEATGWGVDPFERLLAGERQRQLRQAVDELPPRMRRVLTLRLVEGRKYREIAEELGVSLDTVKTALYQAKLRLKQGLGADFTELPDSSGGDVD